MNKLDILLMDLAKEYYFEGALDDTYEENKDVILPISSKIKDLFLELIGEDEQTDVDYSSRDSEANGANRLRNELRDRIDKL